MITLRTATENDFFQLAEMKWLHCEEDDRDYNEQNLLGVDRETFLKDFISFLNHQKDYTIFVAADKDVIASAMFVHLIPKIPKPNSDVRFIAYLTNVFTRREYRNQKIGTDLLSYIKSALRQQHCELIFAWPSEKSIPFYTHNDFREENDIVECMLTEE